MIAPKLKKGDGIRVLAPAKGFISSFTLENKYFAQSHLEEMGLKVTYGKYVNEIGMNYSASVQHRLEDLHEAFADPEVKAILCVLGGTQSNQLLKYLDYGLMARNPKIFCGMSDITALQNAIYAKTGLVTYSGPNFGVFRNKATSSTTSSYFRKMLFESLSVSLVPSDVYCESSLSESKIPNDGLWPIRKGDAKGKILGGNLITFNLLLGSEFAPDISGTILFIEDNHKQTFRDFENHLQAIINLPNFNAVQGLVIGRFQKESGMTKILLEELIKTKPELSRIPIVANVDFGHTVPMITFPVGGQAKLSIHKEAVIVISES